MFPLATTAIATLEDGKMKASLRKKEEKEKTRTGAQEAATESRACAGKCLSGREMRQLTCDRDNFLVAHQSSPNLRRLCLQALNKRAAFTPRNLNPHDQQCLKTDLYICWLGAF